MYTGSWEHDSHRCCQLETEKYFCFCSSSSFGQLGTISACSPWRCSPTLVKVLRQNTDEKTSKDSVVLFLPLLPVFEAQIESTEPPFYEAFVQRQRKRQGRKKNVNRILNMIEVIQKLIWTKNWTCHRQRTTLCTTLQSIRRHRCLFPLCVSVGFSFCFVLFSSPVWVWSPFLAMHYGA